MSHRFQKTRSGSATEHAWLGDCSALCSVAGRRQGTERHGGEPGVYSLRKKGDRAERCGEHSPAWICLKVFMCVSGLQECTEMTDTEGLGKDFAARMQ